MNSCRSSSQNRRSASQQHHMRQSGNVSQITSDESEKQSDVDSNADFHCVICQNSYVAMMLWYMFDFETAKRLADPRVPEALFVTAGCNNCLHPIIHGNYMKGCIRCLFLCECPQVLGDNTIT